MQVPKIGIVPLIFACFVILQSCSSGQKAYQRGDYDEAVLKAINRLQRNPGQRKSRETLAVSYPATKDWHQDNVNRFKASGDDFRWERIVAEYNKMNLLYNEIQRCPACQTIIPNPVYFSAQLDEARDNAARVRYQKGLDLLVRAREYRDKAAAREAYAHFKVAMQFVMGYSDSQDLMEEALYLATWKIIVEPIPVNVRNLAISQEFFENKIQEFLHTMPSSEFVQFYSRKEAETLEIQDADHILALQFDEFVIGQVYLKEREVEVTRDSVVLAMIENGKVTPMESPSTSGPISNTTNLNSPASKAPYQPTNKKYTKTSGVTTQSFTNSAVAGSDTNKGKGGEPGNSENQGRPDKGQAGKDTKGADQGREKGNQGDQGNGQDNSQGQSENKAPDKGKGQGKGSAGNKEQGSDNSKVDKKVLICHRLPGSMARSITIEVSQNAVKAHLDHGDFQGECPPYTPPKPDPGQDEPTGDQSSGDETSDQGNDQTAEKPPGTVMKPADPPTPDHPPGTVVKPPPDPEESKSQEEEDVRQINFEPGTSTDVAQPFGPQPVYGTVKAKVNIFRKSVSSRGVLDFKIYDAYTGQVLTQEKLPGEFVWFTEWGYFNGDERALDDYHREIVQYREVPPPPPQDLFIAFTDPIYQQITEKIRSYYLGY